MTVIREIKSCQECGDSIRGRADKKFCSDQCRVSHHNRINSDENNYVRNVNNLIRRNRRILTKLRGAGQNRISRLALATYGFEFTYFTSMNTSKDGTICYYCYDHGYVPIEKEQYLLVTKDNHDL